MSLIIPEEIKAALETLKDEAADKLERQMAGMKFGFWAVEFGKETSRILLEAKEHAQAYKETPQEQRDPEGFITILKEAALVAARMSMQHELDAIFEEVKDIMNRLFEDDGELESKHIIVCNGQFTDITRAVKSNKNDGDKGVMPA